MPSPHDYTVRKMLPRDVCDVLDIAHEAEQEYSTEEDIHQYIGTRHSAGLVAVDAGGNAVGYILFRDCKRLVLVEALAVAEEWRRKGVATALVRDLFEAFMLTASEKIAVHVPERMLSGQLFWKSAWFKAYKVLRGCHMSGDDLFAFGIERGELAGTPAGSVAKK